jgi:hypothetical protein
MLKQKIIRKNWISNLKLHYAVKNEGFGQIAVNIAVLRIRYVYPGYEFFRPGSKVKKIPDPLKRIYVYLTQKTENCFF